MPVFAIINTSSKGLWPKNEDVTLVLAESREAIIRSILNKKDDFVAKRLTPCHEYMESLIKGFRGEKVDPDDPDDDIPWEVEGKNESQMIEMILRKIDDNSHNDEGFYTAIQKCKDRECNDVHNLQS
jgi:hypothetical protein